jgi:hypothetical protein
MTDLQSEVVAVGNDDITRRCSQRSPFEAPPPLKVLRTTWAVKHTARRQRGLNCRSDLLDKPLEDDALLQRE